MRLVHHDHRRHRRGRGPRTRWLVEPGRWGVRARVERFVEPAVLLLLAERPRHGYELIDELPGPARRTYRLTDTGRTLLRRWADALRQAQTEIAQFLERHDEERR